MDFLNKSYAQLEDLFRQMTPAARITAGLLFVGIVVSLVYLLGYHTTAADEYMFGGQDFSQRDIGAMEAAFAKARLNGWQVVGYRIKIPRGFRDTYYKALLENDAMPEAFVDPAKHALAKDSPLTSNAQRSASMKDATEKRLAQVVRQLKGIEDATVMYDESSTGAFSRNKERSALVAVKASGNRPLEEEEVKAIRSAVKHAIGNLPGGNITVTDLNAGRSYSGSEDGRLGSGDNLYAANKRELERLYKNKIEKSLEPYPGVNVGVNVELDPEVNHTVRSTTLDGKPVAVEKSTTVKETPVPQLNNGGPPGVATNVGNAPRAISANNPSSEKATEERSQERLISSQKQTNSEKAPLVPKLVAASISIPTSYFTKVWKERNPATKNEKEKTPDPNDLKKIEEETKKNVETTVTTLLTLDANVKPLVTVTSFLDLPSPPVEKPSVAETAGTWLASHWQTLAMIFVGIGSLLFLRGMLRTTSSQSAPSAAENPITEVAPLKIADVDEIEDDEPAANKTRRRFKISGPNLREELADLVKEDPDTAANILRNWIGDVA